MSLLFHFPEFEFVHGVFELPDEKILLFRSVHPNISPPPTQHLLFGDYEADIVPSFTTQYDPKRWAFNDRTSQR